MRDYFVIAKFESHNLIGKNKNKTFSVEHIFYNQPDKVDDYLKNYWFRCMERLLYKLYNVNTITFRPVYKDGKIAITITSIRIHPNVNRSTIGDKNHRIWKDDEVKKELEFHAKMFKEESDFLSINEDLLELRNEISDFKDIDLFFSKVEL